MEKSKGLIKFGDTTYHNIVENTLNEHNIQMNNIMKGLTTLSTILMPCTVIGGIMGMNQ